MILKIDPLIPTPGDPHAWGSQPMLYFCYFKVTRTYGRWSVFCSRVPARWAFVPRVEAGPPGSLSVSLKRREMDGVRVGGNMTQQPCTCARTLSVKQLFRGPGSKINGEEAKKGQ